MKKHVHIVICGTNDNGEFTTVETFGSSVVKEEIWPTEENAYNAAKHMFNVYGCTLLINRYNNTKEEK